MAIKKIKIGTRDSQLAVWQASTVQNLLREQGVSSELVYIRSEGDVDTVTPLYELGVQGIFTRSLDAALLDGRIDIAVHSMKDVPVQLARGIQQAAVLERASYHDILVPKDDVSFLEDAESTAIIATSSIRRIAQWLNRYPNHSIENLRGNLNTRLRKLSESNWNGAIFAAAGLERINLKPSHSIDLHWMLPAPAQGAIMVVCRTDDDACLESCSKLNHEATAICTRLERDFLKALMGGCSTPISALAILENDKVSFRGNIVSPDGKRRADIDMQMPVEQSVNLGHMAAVQILENGGKEIAEQVRNQKKQSS